MKLSAWALILWLVVAVGISLYFWYADVFENNSHNAVKEMIEGNGVQATKIGQFTDTMTCNGIVITQRVGIYRVRGKNSEWSSVFASGVVVPNKEN